MSSQGDDWICNQLFWRGWNGYEPETAPLFFALAARSRTVVDVGAHVGYYTLLAALANPSARIYALEPHPDVFARLDANLMLNHADNVRTRRIAAGASDAIAMLYQPVTPNVPSSSSLSLALKPPGARLTGIPVNVRPIDGLVDEEGLQAVDLVKIDTESTEPNVVRGMLRTLRRDRPSIVCEVLAGGPTEAELQALLAPLGYRYYLLTPSGPQLMDTIRGHPRWLNYLFTHLDPPLVARLGSQGR
jgi:FkbM family methyltransferase